MKRLFFVLLTMGCVMFYGPANGDRPSSNNGSDEKTNEQPSIESPESKDDEGGSHGDIEPNKSDSGPQIIHENNERDPITKSINKCLPKTDSIRCFINDFINRYKIDYPFIEGLREILYSISYSLFSAILAIFLAITIREAILGFLLKPKWASGLSICLGVLALVELDVVLELFRLLDLGDIWSRIFITLVVIPMLSGLLVYFWIFLFNRLAIGLVVIVTCFALSRFLPINIYYDIVGVFCGIVGGLWLVCKEDRKDKCNWLLNEFRNRLGRTKNGKEKDVEDVKGED